MRRRTIRRIVRHRRRHGTASSQEEQLHAERCEGQQSPPLSPVHVEDVEEDSDANGDNSSFEVELQEPGSSTEDLQQSSGSRFLRRERRRSTMLGHPFGGRLSGGIRRYNPDLYRWISDRMGSRGKALLLLSLVVLKAVSFIMQDHSKAWVRGINKGSVEVVKHAVSLCISLSVSLILDGEWAVEKICSWHPFWRFLGVSLLFSLGTWFVDLAYKQDLAHAAVELVGYSYMPTAAILSYFIFRRRYGILEWLSMGMMTLAACTFMLLRERYVAGGTDKAVDSIHQHIKTLGIILTLCGVITSALGSTLAEGIFKEEWKSLKTKWSLGHDRFYIMKVHIESSALIFALLVWVVPAKVFGMNSYKDWWGPWGWFEVFQVCIDVALSWVAGLVTQQMNTVVKAIGQTIAGILAVMLGDPILYDRYRFDLRAAPECMLAIIVLMSAIIFQTGRIIIYRLQGQMDGPTDDTQDSNDDEDGPNGLFSTAPEIESPVNRPALIQQGSADNMTNYERVANYACIVLYIFVDCGRTLLNSEALSSSAINPTTMSLLVFVCGALLATCLTIWIDGCAGLRATWRCSKILQCLPAACLFAVGQCLTSFAFALQISAALANVLGKIYTPIAAFGGRCILDRYYSWLEYFAIIILTLASLTFGYLQEYDIATGLKHANMSAILCAVGSALFAAFGSLAMEKILQGVKRHPDGDEEPERPEAYHIQKTRLDFGSGLASLALLPIISTISSRPKDNIWVSRPLGTNCTLCMPVLSNATFHVPWEQLSNVCSPQTCVGECSCLPSIFVGWNDPLLIAALVVNVAQGWLIGKITKQFSTIHRAIADAFSTLLLYWIGEPGVKMLVDGTSYISSVKDLCLDMTSFIVPLSTVTFMVATHQMKRVMLSVARSPHSSRFMASDSSLSDSSDESDRTRQESDESSSGS